MSSCLSGIIKFNLKISFEDFMTKYYRNRVIKAYLFCPDADKSDNKEYNENDEDK